MSEYWVSKKKYFCKYCEIYIADDAPSRQQHENGLRHKGNVERFIRSIYKAGEKQKKDLEEEKREMKRVEQAAAAAFAEDVGAGRAKASSGPVASSSTGPRKPPTRPSDPYANYSTAQSLGYTDPDAERIAAETKIRQSQDVAGEWEVLTHDPSSNNLPSSSEEPTEELPLKREAEAPPDDEDMRTFKLRKKNLQTGLGEVYDPGLIPVKLKKKEPSQEPTLTKAEASGIVKAEPGLFSLPSLNGTKIQLKRPQDISSSGLSESVKTEEGQSSLIDTPASSSKWAKAQWSAPIPDIDPSERDVIFGSSAKAEPDATLETKPDVKLEAEAEGTKPHLKEEEQEGNALPTGSSGGLFKKRKAPLGASRGRRPV